MPLELRVYDKDEAHRKLQQLIQLRDEKCNKEKILRSNRICIQVSEHVIKQVELPSLRTLTIRLRPTAKVNCGHFWAQYNDSDTRNNLLILQETIKMYQESNFQSIIGDIYLGKLVLAPFKEGPNVENYYRAKIEGIVEEGIKVFFIDYGDTIVIPNKNLLKEIDASKVPDLLKIPAQAFECILCEIRPSLLKNREGKWTNEAKEMFYKITFGKELVARVYSVVQNIVRLELIAICDNGIEISINQTLIQEGYAEKAEENYISKKNHELRMKYEMSNTYENNSNITIDTEFVHLTMEEVGQISSSKRPTQKILLHGPFSALECSYAGITHLNSFRHIRIDRDSVNSVTLDSQPEDKHTKMLVSSDICLNSDGTSIKARNTTLMPNIHGLPALVTLTFAPCVEFRIDFQRRQYTGALCGLGYDEETTESLHPDHDIELAFETSFDEDDIITINTIRMGFNLLLGTEENLVSLDVTRIQEKIRKHILELLSKKRNSIEPKEFRHKYKWKKITEDQLLKADLDSSIGAIGDCPYVLPLLKAVKMPEDMVQIKLQEHIRKLHHLVRSKSGLDVNKCRLCAVTTRTIEDLRRHLQDSEHKTKELKLFED